MGGQSSQRRPQPPQLQRKSRWTRRGRLDFSALSLVSSSQEYPASAGAKNRKDRHSGRLWLGFTSSPPQNAQRGPSDQRRCAHAITDPTPSFIRVARCCLVPVIRLVELVAQSTSLCGQYHARGDGCDPHDPHGNAGDSQTHPAGSLWRRNWSNRLNNRWSCRRGHGARRGRHDRRGRNHGLFLQIASAFHDVLLDLAPFPLVNTRRLALVLKKAIKGLFPAMILLETAALVVDVGYDLCF